MTFSEIGCTAKNNVKVEIIIDFVPSVITLLEVKLLLKV